MSFSLVLAPDPPHGVRFSGVLWRAGGLALERRDGVDDGLGFLELGDGLGAAEPADAALFVAALGEAVVDRCPGVRPDGAGVDLAADPAADVAAAGEDARGEAGFGGVGACNGVGLGVEYLEGRDRAENLLLHDVGPYVPDLQHVGPREHARR